MYELVYGFTPFRGAKRDQTFENILKRPLVFPPKPEISKSCQVRCPCDAHLALVLLHPFQFASTHQIILAPCQLLVTSQTSHCELTI